MLALKRAVWGTHKEASVLCSLSPDSSSELNVFWHDGHSLGVNSAQVGIFEETDKVCFAGFLQGHHGGSLEAEIGFEVLSDFTDKSLEWQLADQQLGALLVATDLTQSDSSGPVTMRLLHSSGSRCRLSCSFGGELLSWSFSSSTLASSLLCTRHFHEVNQSSFFQRWCKK